MRDILDSPSPFFWLNHEQNPKSRETQPRRCYHFRARKGKRGRNAGILLKCKAFAAETIKTM
nr:hypothetical protein [uncultured Gellertiella sp.]